MTTSRNFLTTTTKRAKRNTLLALLFVLGVLTCACDGATKGNGLGAKVSKTEPARHSARRSQNLTSAANLGGGGALKGNGLGTKVARTKRPRHSAHRSENLTSSSDLGFFSPGIVSDFVDAVTDLYASIVAYYDEWKTSSSSSSSTTSEMTIDFGESADMCEERAAADWEDEESSQIECTTCGSIGSLLGGYQVLGTGSSVSKAFSDLPTHSIVTINLDFVQIDSWDSERFYVYADNDLVYTSHRISKSTGTQECGSSSNNWNEFVIPASFTFAHSSSSLTLKITTNLNSGPSDESWGIQKVHLKLASDYTTSLERLKYCPDVTTNWAVRYDLSPTCDNGIDLSAYTSGLDVDEAIAKCAECSGCTAVSYKDSSNIRYTSGCSSGDGCLTGWSDWTTYRNFEYCDALSTDNFQTHVDGCLEESPVDGMCYTYGRNNNIGPMSHWDVSEVTSMNQAFYGKSSFNTDLSNWDVSKVTDMYRMFKNTNFQQWLINWDVSSVTDMREMFYGAAYFAGFVGNWRSESTSLLTTDMFSGATTFNAKYSSCGDDGPPSSCRVALLDSTFSDAVSNCLAESATTGECTTYGASSDFGVMQYWDVSGVTSMSNAFKSKSSFNADISSWDVSRVTTMYRMFKDAPNFNQDLSGWDVSSVDAMTEMFRGATNFKGYVGSWNPPTSASTTNMFLYAFDFKTTFSCDDANDGPPNSCRIPLTDATISSAITACLAESSMTGECTEYAISSGYGMMPDWDVSAVTDMEEAFKDYTSFNADLSSWDVSSVENMKKMFNGATSFNAVITGWDVSKVKNMKQMFNQAYAFNQDISKWDVSSVENMEYLFRDATAFDQDISDWSVSTSAQTTEMFDGATAFTTPRQITVAIATTQNVFNDAEIDLEISVTASICASSECNLETTSNERAEEGLYCDVKISDSACSSSDFGDSLPCFSWPNFIDESKAAVYQKTLTTADSNGDLVTGEYTLEYTCGWKFLTGVEFPDISTSRSDFTFNVAADCSEWLHPTTSGVSHADTFLLSAPSFIEISSTSCTSSESIDAIKEALFREYDEDVSGSLSYDEFFNALDTHDVDTSHLEHYESSYSEILLSHVMSSEILPLVCQNTDDFTNIRFTKIHYPDSMSDTRTECDDGSTSCLDVYTCEGGTEILTAEWEHKTDRGENDFVCVYADGKLFRKDTLDQTSDSFPTTLSDIRPSMRTGDDAIEMIAQFTFDEDLRNDAEDDSTAVTDTNFEYISCDDSGGSCLNSVSSNSAQGYAWQDATEMTNSAIMSWVYVMDSGSTATDILYKTTSSNGNYEIVFQLRGYVLEMTYKSPGGGTQTIVTHTITSTSSSSTDGYTWHHVGLVLNQQSSQTVDLYFDGSLVASVDTGSVSWVATDIDASDMTATEKILFTSTKISDRSFIYDDFRIYKGVVTGKHIEAIYSCSRSQTCSDLAHAKPQSRRTYCLLLTIGGLQAGVDRPCATGLYYNGLAVDLKVSMSMKGAMFTFRDTELIETGFEVLRQKKNRRYWAGILYSCDN